MIDLPDEKIGCHRTGFVRKCRELLLSGECNRWIQITGNDPNTGALINQSDCVDNWTPRLLIENSQTHRQTAASVDKVATELNEFRKEAAPVVEFDRLPDRATRRLARPST